MCNCDQVDEYKGLLNQLENLKVDWESDKIGIKQSCLQLAMEFHQAEPHIDLDEFMKTADKFYDWMVAK